MSRQPTDKTDKPALASSELTNFLAILGNTGRSVKVEDVSGTSYVVPTVLPAGKQLELVAALDDALDDATLRGAFDAVQSVARDTGGDQVAALLRFVRLLLKSKNRAVVLSLLDRLVALAHPLLPQPAQDHFEIQEVLRMLLPFASRLLTVLSTVAVKTDET